jgi:hypothetical protein
MVLRVIVPSFDDCERNRRYRINSFDLLKVREHHFFICLISEVPFPLHENTSVVASLNLARVNLLERLFLKQEIA